MAPTQKLIQVEQQKQRGEAEGEKQKTTVNCQPENDQPHQRKRDKPRLLIYDFPDFIHNTSCPYLVAERGRCRADLVKGRASFAGLH
jgi:hypothetical protein